MSYTNGLDKPSDYFNTVLYTGDGSNGQAITGVGFQPDWLWIKSRSGTAFHELHDSVRGAGKRLFSNDTAGESNVGTVSSFDSDGFTVSRNSAYDGTNQSSITFVGWNWLASNTTASNTDGSITSTVSASTTSGFSIVSYTGNLTDGATVGHGLGVTPSCIIFKNRSDVQYWVVYHKDLGGGNNHLRLDGTSATTTALNMFSSTAPNSSVFELGNKEQVNGNTNNIIAYCFAEKKGFSKFGSYTGNGNADGTFVYTGFRPAFILLKQTNSTNYWNIYDNKRDVYNAVGKRLHPNVSDVETSNTDMDFLSNGFKLRNSGANQNGSGSTYIYMAFAENPFVTSTGIPTTAR